MTKRVLAAFVLVLVLAAAVVGCAAPRAEAPIKTEEVTEEKPEVQEVKKESSRLVLRVNPEIEIEYDAKGVILEINAEDADGAKVLEGTDYKGWDINAAIKAIVTRIHELGYFDEQIDGRDRNVIIQLDPEYDIPDAKLIDSITENVRETVAGLELKSGVVSIEEDDYDDRYTSESNKTAGEKSAVSAKITLDKAKEIAAAQAGYKVSEVTFTEGEYDFDDNREKYDVEFVKDGIEYSYEIDIATGLVYDKEIEKDDDYAKKPAASEKPVVSEKPAGTQNAADGYITADKAESIALAEAGVKKADTRYLNAQLEKDDGIVYYEVEFAVGNKEYNIDVKADTGKVIDKDVDIDDDYAEKPAATQKPEENNSSDKKISATKAKNKALAAAGVNKEDARYLKAELEEDDGRWYYEVEFKAGNKEYNIDVDAFSGKVLDKEVETDD